ncbi:MAG: ABC transporter permease [Terriglobia bacterium]
MNNQSNTVPEYTLDAQVIAPAGVAATRPLYWSVRRELWENRSIFLGPLTVAAVILFGFLIRIIHPSAKTRAEWLDPAKQWGAINMPYDIAAFLILLTAFIVGIFYCLDALHGDRRDRSVLFWKSLPVSDLTTVLSKAGIPLAVLPLVAFAIIVATQAIMLLLSTAILPGKGLGAAVLWAQLPLFKMWLTLLYALAAMALWHAPIYGWMLLVSGWPRRATFLWAVLPPFAIGVIEKVAFNTARFGNLMRCRLIGWFAQAFTSSAKGSGPVDPLATLSPGKFLSTPGLWIGLAFAVVFLAAAVRLRRYRGPI